MLTDSKVHKEKLPIREMHHKKGWKKNPAVFQTKAKYTGKKSSQIINNMLLPARKSVEPSRQECTDKRQLINENMRLFG